MEMESERFISIMHHLRTLVSQMKPQGDVTFGEFCIMNMIESERIESGKKLTPTQLNIMLGTKKPATSRLLADLEKKEYIEKINDEKDHRICYLGLTKDGEEILSKEKEYFHRLITKISVRLGKNDIEQISKALEHLSRILEEESIAITEKRDANT